MGDGLIGEWKILSDLGSIQTGRTPKSSLTDAFGGETPFVTPRDFNGTKVIATAERMLSEAGLEAVSKAAIPKESVMVTCIGSDMGKAALSAKTCVTNQQINSLLVDTDIADPEYVYYNLSMRKAEIRAAAGGSAQPILNKTDFGKLEIFLPDLDTQKAITHILGTLDDKIGLNRRMNETLEAMAQTLFKSWFVDFDPVIDNALEAGNPIPEALASRAETRRQILADGRADRETAKLFPDAFQFTEELDWIPEGWNPSRLDDLADIVDCLHSKKPDEEAESGNLLLQVFNVGQAGQMSFAKSYFVSAKDYEIWCSRMQIVGGDLVITKTGRVGAVAQMPVGHSAAMGRNMVGLRAKPRVCTPSFLKDSLLSGRMRREMLMNTSSGTILKSLHVKSIEALSEICPPLEIISAYTNIVEPIHRKIEVNVTASTDLASTRDVLLPKLISGEVSLNSPNDG